MLPFLTVQEFCTQKEVTEFLNSQFHDSRFDENRYIFFLQKVEYRSDSGKYRVQVIRGLTEFFFDSTIHPEYKCLKMYDDEELENFLEKMAWNCTVVGIDVEQYFGDRTIHVHIVIDHNGIS